jgi:hypothetical protein
MRKIALLAAVVAAAMAFANVSSASALSWTPQGTTVNLKTLAGLKLTSTETGIAATCTDGYISGKASGAVFGIAAAPYPLYASQCNAGYGYGGRVKSQGQWSLTATSTSTTTLKADTSPSGGNVMQLELEPGCVIAVKGPLTIPGVAFSNTSHNLTLNNVFPVASRTGFCAPAFGGNLNVQGTFSAPGLAILP